MKKIFADGLLFLALMVTSSVTLATPCVLPLQSFFFGANYNKSCQITAVNNWLTDGTNIFLGSYINVTPSGGTNPIVDLKPNNYTIKAADVPTVQRFTIYASDGTNLVNILSRITNGLASWPSYMPASTTNINNASGTNVTLSGQLNVPGGFFGGLGNGFFANNNITWDIAGDFFVGGQVTASSIISDSQIFDSFGVLPPSTAIVTNAPTYSNEIFVDAAGNDATALKYNSSRAYKTITAAASNAVAGDTIYVRAGYYVLTNTVNLPVGVNLRGESSANTLFTNASASSIALNATISNNISDITICGYTAVQIGTNNNFFRSYLWGTTDIAAAFTYSTNFFIGCTFEANWDGFVSGYNIFRDCTGIFRQNISPSSSSLFNCGVDWSGGRVDVYTNPVVGVTVFKNGSYGTNHQDVVVTGCRVTFWNGATGKNFYPNGGNFRIGNCTYDSTLAGTGITYLDLPQASTLAGVVTNGINSVSGVITNGGAAWYFLNTNGVPAITAPNGSFCSTTNGQFFVRSNTVWLLK